MTIRAALLLFAVVAIAVAPAAARVSTSSKDLLLKKSDMPAGAKRTNFETPAGVVKIPRVHGRAAATGYTFKVGSRRESVVETLGRLGSRRDAHDVYVRLVKLLRGAGTLKKLSVRKVGSQQAAYGLAITVAAAGVLVVHSGTMVWELAVTSFPGLTKGKLQRELSKYAAKAKARIS